MASHKLKSLAGKRIVVTRAPEQASEFISLLTALGARVELLPTVAFAEPEDFAPLDRAISEIDQFEWLIFTSRNAVIFFWRRMQQAKISSNDRNSFLTHVRVAAVGPATAEAALDVGFSVDHESRESRGAALAAELGAVLAGKRVLLPRSNQASAELPAGLKAAGAIVTDVIAYRTLAPESFNTEITAAIRRGEVDVVTLFSPSAFHHLVEEIGLDALRRHSGKMVLAAIGPATSQAVRDAGLRVEIEASEATTGAVAEAIEAYFAQHLHSGAKPR